jgi:hypothetical protein
MNAKKAKALRREIYGDTSLRIERAYVYEGSIYNGTCLNRHGSFRARYQAAKRGR